MTDDDEKLFDYLYKLVDKQADKYVAALVDKVVRDLRKIKVTLSGDDSILANCWDEICVQEQEERFYLWEAYEMTINGVIEGCFEELSYFEKQCVNFAMLQQLHDDGDHDYKAIYTEGIIEFIFKQVLDKAKSYMNARIRKYLEPNFDAD